MIEIQPQIKTKTVKDLSGLKFNVPHYQRGYRWDKTNVKNLLSDLWQFDHENKTQRYSLQPLIVSKNAEGGYDLIDGQQRLTTLELILQHAYKGFAGQRTIRYEIEYDTRPDSQLFLESFGKRETATQAMDNADYYHMHQAWEAIEEWCEENEVDEFAFSADIGSKVQNHVMLIWYEVSADTDPVELFRRVNIGRIPLTNSELVKALLLTHASEADRRDIAYGWDDLERRLQNDQFWYFLSNDDSPEDSRRTRVDLLLQIWRRLRCQEPQGSRADHFAPFHTVDAIIQESRAAGDHKVAEEVHAIWQELKDIFSQLEYWFTDHQLYHRIGFLLATGSRPEDLFARLAPLDKNEVNETAISAIRAGLSTGKDVPTTESIAALDVTKPKNTGLIRKLLLLFNIETILADGDDYVRFSFEAFKKEQWDIEHIHALADRPPRDERGGPEARRRYFEELRKETQTVLTDDAVVPRAVDRLTRAIEGGEFMKMSTATKVMQDEAVQGALERLAVSWDQIGNLALLDSSTNRAIGNNTFPEKRKDIIKRQRGARFIPVCTRNVFLGYYRQDPEGSSRWTDEDQNTYIRGPHGLLETLDLYLGSVDDEEH